MLKINARVTNQKAIKNNLNVVKVVSNSDIKLLEFLKDKFMNTLNEVIDLRLKTGTTNDEYIEEYKTSNKFEDISNGFILYNDLVIPQSQLSVGANNLANYPNGFSLALAFEYGVGIVAQNSPAQNAWDYNINNYAISWKYTKNGKTYTTSGYQGMEIYRYTAIEINNNLYKWIKEYSNSEGNND